MKKELIFGIILAVLFALVIINIYVLNGLCGRLQDLLTDSRRSAEAGDWGKAVEKAEEAEQLWNKADPYTHIVVRHSEIDSATDAFYDLLKALYSEDEGEAKGSYMLLDAHLTSIVGMEKITLGSIF